MILRMHNYSIYQKESTVELIPIDQPLQVFSGSALHSSHTADHKKDVKPIFLKSVFEDSKESILLGIKVRPCSSCFHADLLYA